MNNYSEQIFQSIDTIISQRLNEVKFDRTITCEVIAGVKDYPNKYWVSDGTTKFQSCVADSSRTYTEKQKVYVLIPNGDYNSTDKVIIGSYTADELPKNLYTNPFDHLVYSSKYEVGLDEEGLKILANDAEKDYESAILSSVKFEYSNTTPFDYVGLEFSFNTTDLDGLTQGNYGLRIILKHIEKNKEPEEIANFVIDSSQLYGNIYNLNSLIKFQQLFPIPIGANIVNTNNIEIQLYQRKNFDTEETNKYIYLKSAILYFGYDVEKIDSNKLTLYFDKTQSLTFDEKDNVKTLYLEWEDTDLKKIYSFNQEQPSSENYKYTTYWCKYVPGYKKNKDEGDIEETGVYWKTIGIENSFIRVVDLDSQNNTQQFKVGVKYRNQEEAEKLLDQQEEEKKVVIQDTSLTNEEKQKKINEIEEKYKKLIDALWKYFESNVLIFTNEDVKPEPGSTNNSEDSIKLTCSDSGVYNYYTYTGNIVDTSYLTQERTITATFLDGYDFPDPNPESNNIKWIIPTENTMISKIATGISNDKKSAYLKYKITNNYWPGIKENNTITCEVKFPNGEIRRGRIALQFGGESAVGSEYFFNIYFADNKYSLQYNKKDSLKVKVAFGRRDGEKISVKPAINWEILNPAGITLSTATGEEITLNREATSAITNNLAILKAFTDENYQLGNGLTAKFEAYLPIPLSSEGHHISGPTKIVYDTTNSNLKRYSNKPYVLYDKDNKEIAGISWEIYYDKGTVDNPNPYPIDYPVLKNNKLYPIANALDNMPVVCVNAIKNNIVIWSQPIYFSKYRWEFGLLNNWSGKLTIDKEQNAIMAATLVAGKKADDNSFTGIAMGEIINSSTKKLLESGLYGFEKGVSRFYLNNSGAFFVGDGNNYISFNDINKGTRDDKGNATFAVNVNKLLLNTPQTKIISSKPTSAELNLLNISDQLRVKLGWIKDEVYGLDIYNGAFRMYGVPWNKDLTDEDANIYFKTENDITNMYIRGKMLFSTGSPFTASPINISQFENILFGGGTMQEATEVLYGTQYNFFSYGENYNFYSGLILDWDAVGEFWTSGLFFGNVHSFLAFHDDKTGTISTTNDFSIMPKGFGLYCSDAINIQTSNGNITIGPSRGAPTTSGLILGSSGYKTLTLGTWTGSVSSSTTSDFRYKNSIAELPSAYSTLFDNLIPKRFKYNDGTSNRFHTGFIAQDVNKAIKDSGLTTQDFAATVLFNKGEENEQWTLRYEEFIALNTWQIQKLKQRVTELENEIKEIKQNENN